MVDFDRRQKLQDVSDRPHYTVVMTACIHPGNGQTTVPVRRSDPEVRLKDYQNGLRFWLHLQEPKISQIILIENSGYPLDSLKKIAEDENVWHRRCEFISLGCNEIPEGIHYGYSEFKLLHLGLEKSQIIQETSYFIKATGRYSFPNISRLLNHLPKQYKIAADTRDVTHLVPYPRKNVTVALIIFETEFYQTEIQELYREMKVSPRKAFIEDILYDKLIPMKDDPEVILRWSCSCEPHGIGGNGHSYHSFKKKGVTTFRAIGRVLFPNWWL